MRGDGIVCLVTWARNADQSKKPFRLLNVLVLLRPLQRCHLKKLLPTCTKLCCNEMPDEQGDSHKSECRGGTCISSYGHKMKKPISNFFQSCLILTENSRDDSPVPAIPSSHPVTHRQLKSHRQEAEMDVVSVSFSCNDQLTWSQLHSPPPSFLPVEALRVRTH